MNCASQAHEHLLNTKSIKPCHLINQIKKIYIYFFVATLATLIVDVYSKIMFQAVYNKIE